MIDNLLFRLNIITIDRQTIPPERLKFVPQVDMRFRTYCIGQILLAVECKVYNFFDFRLPYEAVPISYNKNLFAYSAV